MIRRTALALLSLALIPQVGLAQGTITAGNVRFAIGALPPNPNVVGTAAADFTANGLAVPDLLFQHGWFYRIDPTPREFTFNTGGGQVLQNYLGNSARLHWPDVDFRGQISATWNLTVQSTGPTSGTALSQMVITNLSSMPIRLSLFAYADIDLCGAGGNSAVGNPGPDRHLVTSAACPTQRAGFESQGHDHFEVRPFNQLVTRFADPVPDNLTDTGLPFAPGDYTGAFQWQDRILLPQQNLTATVLLTHGSAIPSLGSIADANARYTVFSVPASRAALGGQATFTANPAVQQVASQHWWYYRLNADPRESAFNDSGGQLIQSYVGNTATFDWSDADQRGIRALWTLTVQSTGPASGSVWSRMSITNNTGLPLTLNLFAHANLDMCQTPGNEVANSGTTFARHTVQSVSPCGNNDTAEYSASAPDRYEVQPSPVLLGRLLDGAADTLGNTGLPFGPGDYAGAFQWRNRVLQPGHSFTAEIAIAHNQSYAGPGRIRRVAPAGAPYQQITTAIADAGPGDVVLVAAGTYEPFVLDKGLTVLGRLGANPVVLGESRVRSIPAGQTAALGGLVFRSREWLQTATDSYALLIEPGPGTVVLRNCAVETGPVTWRGSEIPAPVAALSVSGCPAILDGVSCQGRSGTHALVAQGAVLTVNQGSYRGGASDCGLFCFPDSNPAGAGIVVAGGTAYLCEVNAAGGAVTNLTRTSVAAPGVLVVGGTMFARGGAIAGGTGSVHPGGQGGDGIFNGPGGVVHVDGANFVPGAAGSVQGTPGLPVSGPGTVQPRQLAALTYATPYMDLGAVTTLNLRARPGEPHVLVFAFNTTPMPGQVIGVPEPVFLAPPNFVLATVGVGPGGTAALPIPVPSDVGLFGIPILFQAIGLSPTQGLVVGPPAATVTHSAGVQ